MKQEVPTSSLPSMKDMESLFTRLEEEGYTHAVAVTLSTGLSGIYNGVKLVSENHPNIKTFVFDSKSISMGEGVIVEEIGKLIEEGKSFDEIVGEIPNIRKRIHLFFVVKTLEYLRRGGRIGLVSGTIGQLLNIKPIISIEKEGKYYTYDKVRGAKQSIKRIIEVGKELLEKNCKIYVMNGDGKEDAEKVYEDLKKISEKIKRMRIFRWKYKSCIWSTQWTRAYWISSYREYLIWL
jgi:DegV family protein with EDD domain